MISPKCDKCGCELEEFGAILLGPPDKYNMAHKCHLCIECYDYIINIIDTIQ